MMRRASIAWAMVLALLAAAVSAASAQEQSVLLRLGFRAGETMRYRVHADAQGVVSMNLPGAAQPQGMPGTLPVRMVVQGEGSAQVLRVDASGAARLRVRAESMTISMDMLGQRVEVTVKGGKYSVKQNGQPVEAGKIPLMPGGGALPLLQQPIEIKLGPRGEVLDLVVPGFEQVTAMMQGMSFQEMMKGQILLPEAPLVVGQPWSESKTETVPGLNAPITYSFRMTLNGIEDWGGGRRVANLRVESVTTAHDLDLSQTPSAPGQPQMSGTMSMDQQLAGTMLFDATRGLLVRFDFQVDQQMSMHGRMPMPGAGDSMDMDMQLTIKGALAKI